MRSNEVISRSQFFKKAAKELLADGQPHSYGEIVQYPLLKPKRILEVNFPVGLFHIFHAAHPKFLQRIQVYIDIAGKQIRHQILVHRLLEEQMPYPFPEGTQLSLQHI